MIVYILSFVGIAICMFMLYVIYSAQRAEERKDQAYVDMWNRKSRKGMEGYYIYLGRKHERACKKRGEVKKND